MRVGKRCRFAGLPGHLWVCEVHYWERLLTVQLSLWRHLGPSLAQRTLQRKAVHLKDKARWKSRSHFGPRCSLSQGGEFSLTSSA